MAKPTSKIDTQIEDFPLHVRPKLESALEGMALLQKVTEDDVARIPEDLFREYLMPVLANRSGNQSLVRWQQLAGHVMRGIEVCDTQTGEPLFRVPPILRSINEEFTGKGSRSAYEIIRTAENKRRIVPSLGDRHIQTHLVDQVRHVRIDSESVKAWNEILKRYGYPPLLKMNTSPVGEKEEEPIPVDLEVIAFDDF